MTISGGTLNDPGAITVGGLLTLSGGTLSGLATAGAHSGTGTTTANGGITLNPASGDFNLDGETLTNAAGQTATFSGTYSNLLEQDGADRALHGEPVQFEHAGVDLGGLHVLNPPPCIARYPRGV